MASLPSNLKVGKWVLRPRGLPNGRSRALEGAGSTAKLLAMQAILLPLPAGRAAVYSGHLIVSPGHPEKGL